ncbi:unnamed protein product [Spirodela intermedia]|uniref:Co-chaperone protein p23 n=1 Tax=Spirodela intermedia TaxID=51605 RepID=A0A7I8IGL9_SPIIN|nr:unnamed protein product [Spirodela intermedia]CAA6657019.1 unnamed protein product [Spirodela intermedia]
MSRHPTTKWAQRSDEVYLKIELPDAKDVSLELQPEGKFIFSATKDGVPYEIEIDLFDKINVEESKATVGVRHIAYVIKKAEKKWWSRILKQEGKPPAFLKVDWDRWVDEEETKRMDVDKRISRTKKRRHKRKANLLQKLMARLKPKCACVK